jgi:hypothetical protein
MAKTFLESYWIATRSFIQREHKSKKRGDLLKNMNFLGLRFNKLGLIDHMEAVSKVNFNNAINFISEDILQSHQDPRQVRKKLNKLSQRIYELSHYRA